MSDVILTDDDIARLFADANPVPTDAVAPGDPAHDDRVDIRLPAEPRRRSDTGTPGRTPWRLLGAAAAVAALLLGLVVARGGDDRAPADEPAPTLPPTTTTGPIDGPDPEPVRSLVEAFNARDAAGMRATLAGAADPTASAAIDDIVAALEWFDTWKWRWTDVDCSSSATDALGCDLVVENRLTEYTGTPRFLRLDLTTTDGLIRTLTVSEDFEDYSTAAFTPFIEYVAGAHADDVGRMWSFDTFLGLTPSTEQLALFDAYLTEYTAEPEPPTPLHRQFLDAHEGPAGQRSDVTDMFAPGGRIAGAWADDPASYAAALDVLAAWEFEWGDRGCEIVAVSPPRIRCSTDPSSVFDATGAGIAFGTVVFEMGAGGITTVEAYGLADAVDDALQPFYDWIAAEHPDDALTVLTTDGDGWSVVMDATTAARLGALATEYVDRSNADRA